MNEEDLFVFLIPEGVESPSGTADRFGQGSTELQRHALLPAFLRSKEVGVSPDQLRRFWNEKVVALTDTLTTAQENKAATGFRVDEISFSIGVGAKGGLAFVAEASAEATISVTLRRPPNP